MESALRIQTLGWLICLALWLALTCVSRSWAFGVESEDLGPEADIPSADISVANNLDIPLVTFKKNKGRPVLDGKLQEDYWQQAQHFLIDLEMYPTRFAKAVVKTDAYIAISSTHVFIAFSAFDPDVTKIRSAPRTRDGVKEDDYVSLVIDPTGSGTKQYEFRINPHGTLTDVLQDTVSDRYIYDWDTDWTGAATLNDNGYSAEIAIPLQSIKFPARKVNSDNRWLIMLKRSYPRSVDSSYAKPIQVIKALAIVTEDGDSMAGNYVVESTTNVEATSGDFLSGLIEEDDGVEDILPASAATQVGDKRNAKIQNVSITPYYIFHPDEERSLGGSFRQVDEYDTNEAGFSGSAHIGTDKTLGVTVNPNFTEVEADIARESINNPFEVFQPEKRTFFQTGGELYNTTMPAVYTRNIIAPEVGVSYTQTTEKVTGGLFWINDRLTQVIVPDSLGSETATLLDHSRSAAARYQQVFGKQAIGLLGTMRTGEDGYHNYVGGVDGLLNLGLDDKLRYQLLFSNTHYSAGFAQDLCNTGGCTERLAPEDCVLGECEVNAYVLRSEADKTLTGHALRLNYKHDGPNSLYWLNYYDITPDFRADLGFTSRADVRLLNAAYGHKWYFDLPNNEGKARIQTYGVFRKIKSFDNEDIEESFTLFSELRGWRQTVFRFGPAVRERAVNRINQNSLELGDNAPLFDEKYWIWYYEVAPSVKWTFNFDGRYGDVADPENLILGTMKEYKPRLRFRLDNFEFRLEAVLRDFHVPGGELYEERFYTLGATYRRSKRFSHRLLFIHDETKRNLDLWRGPAPDKEVDLSFEYSFVFTPDNYWKILAGVKLGEENDEPLAGRGLTNREVFLKIERKFNFQL